MRRVRLIGVALLLLAVLASAIAVVWTRHRNRVLFVELTALQKHRDALNVDFGRLEIEQATWAEPGRIEREARTRLHMVDPPADAMRLLR